jgi:NADH-quinone oxidoreductase subunit J
MDSVVAPSVFSYLAAASVTSAILAVTRRNPVHSMLWVLALFLHVGGVFLLAGAEFLAAVQVIVYAGAILVFYLFVLMLLDLPSEVAGPRFAAHWPLCTAAGVAFVALAWYAVHQGVVPHTLAAGAPSFPDSAASSSGPLSLAAVGTALFTQFALPFEVASLILLAAIVGAIVVAKRTVT